MGAMMSRISPALRQLSRSNLLALSKAVMPDYQIGWVHREICAKLMEFYVRVKEKDSPRLILTMPPRHGKSQLSSRNFPSWCFGVDPNIHFINASYSSNLAESMNRDVQKIMQSDNYHYVFPNTNLLLNKKNNGIKSVKTSSFFEIPGYDGSLQSAGVEGGITGRGADILSIDDPFKNRKEADSSTIRNNVWNWYASTAYTRLSPGGGIVVTVTRWHEDDLVGRLLDAMKHGSKDNWTIINYPAIAERDERFRKKGEALHPERFNLEALHRIKANIGEYEWSALYQQRPTPRGGGIIKKKWIRHWQTLPRGYDRIIQSWDFTFGKSETSDRVSGQVWMKAGADYYLLDNNTDKMEFVEQQRAIEAMSSKWPQAVQKVVEAKANGAAIISSMSSRISGIKPYEPRGSKEARLYAVSPVFESGNVYLPPESPEYPWVSDYENELLSFPNGQYDDQVDATTMALDELIGVSGGILSMF